MADYFPASIVIGGEIDRQGKKELVKAIVDDGGCIRDWDADPANAINVPVEIERCIKAGCPLDIFDASAAYGQFPETEAVCDRLGLTWVRTSESKFEFDASICWGTPTGGGQTEANQAGEPLVPLDSITRLVRQEKSPSAILLDLQAFVRRHTPPDVPPLSIKEV